MKVALRINGEEHRAEGDWNRSLLAVLREDLVLTDAKPGCEIGRCGACTVLLDGEPVNSCLVPLTRLEGREVVTSEGLPRDVADPILGLLSELRAAQCGYCISGLLVTLAWLRMRGNLGTDRQDIMLLAGNLCRCSAQGALLRDFERLAPTKQTSGS
jgi:carbon-monoxide dehydrogenase small subunit